MQEKEPNELVVKLFKKLKLFKVSVPLFADQTGIPKDRVYKWKQENTSPKAEDVKLINEWISKMEKPPRGTLKTGKKIPFYDAEASASDISLTEMTAISAPAGTIDIGDLLNDSDSAIRIYGNSMMPNYPPGCVVGLKKVTKKFIIPGDVYVLETTDQRVLKRLFYKDDSTDGDALLCVSDNTMKFEGGARSGKLAYPPFEILKEDVVRLFLVTGVVKRNSNSIIINR